MAARTRNDDGVRDPVQRADAVPGWHRKGSFPREGYRWCHAWDRPFPEFPAFDHINEAVCNREHVLGQHRHPTLEICYFVAGEAQWTVSGRPYRLRAGDLFLARPGELHGGRPDPEDPNHNCAIGIDPAALPLAPLLGADRDLAQAMAEVAAVHDERRVIRGGQGAEVISRRILSELDQLVGATPAERAITLALVQCLLVELLLHVSRCALRQARGAEVPGEVHPALHGLRAWLATRLADPPGVAEMAARCGLSPTHFAAMFRRAYGITPLDYLTRERVRAAAERLVLEPRAAVTDIALDLGFCSSQYFSAVFRRVQGCTPVAWRRTRIG